MASPLDRAEPVIFRPLTEPRDRDSRRFYAIYVAYFMKNQSLHGGFILPIQLDNFFYSEQNRVSAVKRCRPARAVAQPQIENNIRLDAVFKKPLYIARKLVGHGDKGVVCRNRRVPVEQHVIDYGQHVIIEIIFPRIPFAFFRQAPAKSRGRMLSMHQLKGAVLKAAGYFIKVFIILIALFLRFSQIILPALTYAFRRRTRSRWRVELFARRKCIAARQQLEAVGRYIFAVFLREDQHFPRDSPPAILRDGHRPPLSRAYIRRSRTIFQLNADEAGEAVLRLPSATMTASRLFVKRGANAFFRSLALAVELCIEALKLSPHRRPMPISPFSSP